MIEEVVRFGDPSLVGVLCRPAGISSVERPGIVLLSPGLLHRMGPHRTYVKLARDLAAAGFNVLRFDMSSRGDSPPRVDHVPPHESPIVETIVAMECLVQRCESSRFLLIGHCSGAFYGLMTAFEDERVAGVVAISPEGGDEDWLEYDRRRKEARYYSNYYGRQAMIDSGRWHRFLTGKADYRSIARTVFRTVVWYRVSSLGYRLRTRTGSAAREAGERPEVREFKAGLQSLAARRVPILMVHPDQSAGRELMRAVLGTTIDELRAAGNLDVALIARSDHLFTPLAAQRDLIDTIRDWVEDVSSPVPAGPSAVVAR